MTAIGAVGAVGGFTPLAPVRLPGAAAGTDATAGSGQAFGAQLAQGLEQVGALQNRADELSVQAATGQLKDVHDYTIAATQASLATDLTVALRNKAVDAFTEIMRMQI